MADVASLSTVDSSEAGVPEDVLRIHIISEELSDGHQLFKTSMVDLARIKYLSVLQDAAKLTLKDYRTKFRILGMFNLGAVQLSTGQYGQSLYLLDSALELMNQFLVPSSASRISDIVDESFSIEHSIWKFPVKYVSIKVFREKLFIPLPDNQKIVGAVIQQAQSFEELFVELLNQYALANEIHGELEKARNALKRSIFIQKTIRVDIRLLDLSDYFSIVLTNMGKFLEAEMILEEAIDLISSLCGGKSREVTTAMNNLAVLYTFMGNYSEANSLQVKVLQIRLYEYGKNHPYTELAHQNFKCIQNLAESNLELES